MLIRYAVQRCKGSTDSRVLRAKHVLGAATTDEPVVHARCLSCSCRVVLMLHSAAHCGAICLVFVRLASLRHDELSINK